MNIKLKTKWLGYLLKANEQRGFFRGSLLALILILGAGVVAVSTAPNWLKTPDKQSANISSPSTSQPSTPTTPASSVTPDPLGQELMQEVFACISSANKPGKPPDYQALQARASQCLFQVVLLAPDGSVRDDASDRLTAVVKSLGVAVTPSTSEGEAKVEIKRLTNSQVFTVPVIVGGKTKTFLLDTGASNSIVDSETAKQLKLASTPIPSELMKYMVVGDDCSELKGNIHPLPLLAVRSAKVKDLQGLGLPPKFIPGKLTGVLGLDFLSSFDVVLNPKTSTLQLLPPSQPVKETIPLVGKLGVMIVETQIDGKGPFRFLLDTGADRMVISKRLAQKLALDRPENQKIEVLGFCGIEIGRETKLDRVSVRQHQATKLDAIILDSKVLYLLGVDGIIGQNFLNRYQQHWRFGQKNALGFPEVGSLELTEQF
ncbi:MAG: retroviral-like aspartic protease family protein [Cyanosarcina radialis HA8281-LM2]|jgi:predicted aspartyl protease|nr:retroviral-like aspartic protease family protein [Cyanosarcina radialis HA8281-LM2]